MTTAELDVDALVDATPEHRDRSVDFLRAFSIVVVVLWHWVFSVTHWTTDGALTMPNPIGDVPALWVLTWVLQIMPLFFFVGGFANLVSWRSNAARGGDGRDFLASRLRRLLTPIGVFIGVACGFDVLVRLVDPSRPSVLHWGFVVFVP
jgi:peptidoglycan/LPS O-acetylase OafA/YrhL